MSKQNFEFQAEVGKILNIVANSLTSCLAKHVNENIIDLFFIKLFAYQTIAHEEL